MTKPLQYKLITNEAHGFQRTAGIIDHCHTGDNPFEDNRADRHSAAVGTRQSGRVDDNSVFKSNSLLLTDIMVFEHPREH